MIEFILFCIGLAILVKGADFLVDGASSIAGKLKIAPIVIGLTIVSFGTSAPELIVSLTSSLKGNTDIAFGNVVGSNILNILLILGLTAVIYPLIVHKNTIWKEIPMSFLGAILLVILGLQTQIDVTGLHTVDWRSNEIVGGITKSNGLVLLAFFAIFLYYTFGIAKVSGDSDVEIKDRSYGLNAIYIIGGLIALTIGARISVDNAVELARMLGLSDTLIGLTIVAAGTSFPELFTNIAAARKKNTDIAVGNIVGSNIFNIFFILGVTSLFKEIPIRGAQLVDIGVLWVTTLLLFVFMFILKKHRIGRTEGIIMLICYVAYTGYLIIRG